MDVSRPDKFFTHQADAVARQGCILFRQFRIAQVHINLGAGGWEEFRRYGCAGSSRRRGSRFCLFQDTFIYNAVGRVNGNIRTVRNRSRSSSAPALAANNTGNPQFAAYNGSVAGHTAAVRYDSFRFLHSGNPVRRRHFRNQNFALFKLINHRRIQNDMRFAGNLSGTCRRTLYDNFPVRSNRSLLFRFSSFFCFTAAPYGFRTGLQDPDLAVPFVNAPFHIHIATIMLFNLDGVAGQFFDLLVRQLLAFPFRFRYGNFFHVSAGFADQFDFLGIYRFFQNFQFVFGNQIIIRGYSALNHIFAQAVSAFDQNVLIIAVRYVYREHYAGRFRVHHHLDNRRQRNVQMVETLFFTVIHRAVGKAGCIAFFNLLDDHLGALHIQVGILLACKTGVGQIFRSRAGPYGYIRIFFADFLPQFFIRFGDSRLQIFGHLFVHDGLAQFGADIPQLRRILHVRNLSDQRGHFFLQAGRLNKVTIRISSGRISVRHGNVRLRRHFSQRRRFSANNCHILAFHLLKPQQILFFFLHSPCSFFKNLWYTQKEIISL